MMMRGMMRLAAGDREPVVDNHPLARADGGWYPGKRFDPTDVLTDPRNWVVWKQFLIFFISILFVPIGSFIGSEWAFRHWLGLHFQQSQTAGALLAVVCLQGLMYYYATVAFGEEKRDYAAQTADADASPTAEAAPLLAGQDAPVESEVPVETETPAETKIEATSTSPAGVETAAVARQTAEEPEKESDEVVEESDKKEA